MTMIAKLALLTLSLAFLVSPPLVFADRPITVGSGTPETCTQLALENALQIARTIGGGTIHFKCGPDPAIIALTESVTEIGLPLPVQVVIPDGTTIKGGGLVTLDGQVGAIMIFVDNGTTAALQGLTITCSTDCLGVYNKGTLKVSNSTLSHQLRDAIRNEGTLDVSRSTFSDNGNGSFIGGAINNAGFATVAHSKFSGNIGSRGGAVVNGGTFIVKNSVFSDNAGFPGAPSDLNGPGTIWNFAGGTLMVEKSSISGSQPTAILNAGIATIERSEISGNSNPYLPGGAINNTGALTIQNSIVAGNVAHGPGGGILNGGTLTIEHSEIFGNSAELNPSFGGAGGGIFNGGTLTITKSSLYENSAATFGGAIFSGGTLAVSHSTITRNTATDGGGIYNNGGTLELTHTDVTANTPNDIAP